MKKKIVFVNQSTGYITIDIVNEFAKDYDEVAVLSSGIREQDIALHHSVELTKIIRKSRKSNLQKGVRWLIATIQIYFLLLTKYRKHEVFYFTLPPFSYFCSFLLKRNFSVMIFDVYPDVLKSFKVKESNLVYVLWAKINRILFSRSLRIFTIGDGMAKKIAQYVDKEKISIVPLWTGLSDVKPISKSENRFAKENNLTDKFIIQYSGNIGHTHDIEPLIHVARELTDYVTIHFLIIGRGNKVNHISSLIEKYNLPNCTMLPFQPDNMIRYSLATADIGVVVIEETAAQMSVPSKIFNIMAVGSSLLCIAPNDSELKRLVNKHNNGEVYHADDIQGIKEYILKLHSNRDLLNEYKRNSFMASSDYTRKNAADIFELYMESKR